MSRQTNNSGARDLCRRTTVGQNSRHVERKMFKMRELQHQGKVRVGLIPTAQNAADLFTKPLPMFPTRSSQSIAPRFTISPRSAISPRSMEQCSRLHPTTKASRESLILGHSAHSKSPNTELERRSLGIEPKGAPVGRREELRRHAKPTCNSGGYSTRTQCQRQRERGQSSNHLGDACSEGKQKL